MPKSCDEWTRVSAGAMIRVSVYVTNPNEAKKRDERGASAAAGKTHMQKRYERLARREAARRTRSATGGECRSARYLSQPRRSATVLPAPKPRPRCRAAFQAPGNPSTYPIPYRSPQEAAEYHNRYCPSRRFTALLR